MLKNKSSLSVVILTKNEEENVANAIKSVKNIADEVLVIDDNSIDQTIQIVHKLGVKVYKRRLEDFSKQRNYALKKAKGEWVLFIDADEIVSSQLTKEIKKALDNNSFNGHYIPRKDYFLGKPLNYGEAGSLKLLRLAKKAAGQWCRGVHETWNVNEKVGSLKNSLYHYSHRNISEFVDSINKFSSLHAKENIKEGKESSIFKIVFWSLGKFFYNYIYKLGFLDGTRGLIYAVLMSFHSFLAWSKQWTEENK